MTNHASVQSATVPGEGLRGVRGTGVLSLVALAVASAACGGGSNPTEEDISTALGSAAAIGYISTLSFDGPSSPSACVHASASCTTFPCDASVTVNLGGQCPTPLASTASASVNVTGHWTSATAATLQVTSVTATAGAQTVAVASVRNVSVARSGNSTTVQYAGSDATAHGVGTTAASASWTVTIDSRGTPDTTDDQLSIAGTSQGATTLSGSQVNVTGVVIDPSQCQRNPISGMMTIQAAGLTTIRQDTVTFHSTCDGTAALQGIGGASTLTLDFLR